jgi:Fic family protein
MSYFSDTMKACEAIITRHYNKRKTDLNLANNTSENKSNNKKRFKEKQTFRFINLSKQKQKEFISDIKSDMTPIQIGHKWGIEASTVIYIAKSKLDIIKTSNLQSLKKERIKNTLELQRNGLDFEQIANQLKISKQTVVKYIKENESNIHTENE